jgi:hypothetical protein
MGEALALRGRLESEGIETLVPDEHLGTIYPGATGLKIRVQVRPSQLDDARSLLQLFEVPRGEVCKLCGGEMMWSIAPTLADRLRAFLSRGQFVREKVRVCANCKKVE